MNAFIRALPIIGYRRNGSPIYAIAGGSQILDRYRAERSSCFDFVEKLTSDAEAEGRDLSDTEQASLKHQQERVAELDKMIKPLEDFEALAEQSRNARPPAPKPNGGGQPLGGAPKAGSLGGITQREQKYETRGEFIVDWIRAVGFRSNEGQEQAPDQDANQRVAAALGRSVTEHRALIHRAIQNQTTAQTPGLLPVPIVGTINNDLDAARPFVSSVGARPLGNIYGKQFNRPFVSQHTQTGEQTAEKTELTSRQLVIDDVTFSKRTFGGALNVSYQDIDWTNPAAWDAILTDLQTVYGTDTEDLAAAEFAAGVTQSVEIAGADTIEGWVNALYDAAVMAATANGTKRASALRLPNHIWVSLDRWAAIGKVIDALRASSASTIPAGSSTPQVFAGGDLLGVTRTMAPGLPDGTVIVGRTSLFEFYEQRIGLLQAVEPKILGIEVAHGGYAAWGFMPDATAFAKVVDLVAG